MTEHQELHQKSFLSYEETHWISIHNKKEQFQEKKTIKMQIISVYYKFYSFVLKRRQDYEC